MEQQDAKPHSKRVALAYGAAACFFLAALITAPRAFGPHATQQYVMPGFLVAAVLWLMVAIKWRRQAP